MDQNADPLRAPARTAAVLPGDIADRGRAETLPQPAADALGGLDVLVNNAGVQRFSE